MSKKHNNSKSNNGFTLIEVLIAISLVAVSMLAILNAFIYQGKVNNSINDRNVAIVLAEEKVEEFFKFPYTDMPLSSGSSATDYIYYNLNRTPVYSSTAPTAAGNRNVFRRVVTVTEDIYTTRIDVVVNYGYNGAGFDFSVDLSTLKGG